ncbi:SiaB family protein kinase [Sulfurimonas sp.]|uniref:SiaB family protein kinase n=1 Tax=Sulfurimonas sp. TaxID=2022749 RepID=UPI0025DE7EDB|nr:SiaB family protein kinase [Sulfurimonas sp.]
MNINHIQHMVEEDGIVFLSYGGFLSQELISGMTEALEKEAQYNDLKMNISNNIFIIFIELSQNMMNYSKTKDLTNRDIKPEGLILVSKDIKGNYFIDSQNIVAIEDKDKIEPRLQEIESLDKEGIKKRYRELRKNGKNTHGKGGGIGFYEIAKKCTKIEYKFKEINKNKFYFHVKAHIATYEDVE